jgi:hypothetical protein
MFMAGTMALTGFVVSRRSTAPAICVTVSEPTRSVC